MVPDDVQGSSTPVQRDAESMPGYASRLDSIFNNEKSTVTALALERAAADKVTLLNAGDMSVADARLAELGYVQARAVFAFSSKPGLISKLRYTSASFHGYPASRLQCPYLDSLVLQFSVHMLMSDP